VVKTSAFGLNWAYRSRAFRRGCPNFFQKTLPFSHPKYFAAHPTVFLLGLFRGLHAQSIDPWIRRKQLAPIVKLKELADRDPLPRSAPCGPRAALTPLRFVCRSQRTCAGAWPQTDRFTSYLSFFDQTGGIRIRLLIDRFRRQTL
jgi:hypothetical protein